MISKRGLRRKIITIEDNCLDDELIKELEIQVYSNYGVPSELLNENKDMNSKTVNLQYEVFEEKINNKIK